MTGPAFVSLLTFALPMFSAAVCLVLVMPGGVGGGEGRGGVKLRRLLGAYFGVAAFAWFSILVYPLFTVLTVHIQAFTYLSFISMQVLFYHFVFNITRLDPGRRFPPAHYFLPVAIFAVVFVWSFFVPWEVRVDIIESRASRVPPGYEAYFYLATSRTWVRLGFSVVYTVLALVRTRRYRRLVVDFSANEERSSLRWIDGVLAMAMAMVLLPAITVAVGRMSMYTSALSVVTALVIAAQHVILTANTLRGKYLVPEEAAPDQGPARGAAVGHLSVAEIEAYIGQRKPYLDPNLRITDMAIAMGTNRTYLSAFINETYGMNFSRYINRLRMTELERLRADPAYGSLPEVRLAEMAGFGSYRNYQRARG